MNTLNQWQHWPAFWQLVREHDICPESDKERLGECELCKGHDPEYSAKHYAGLCCWESSGFAGEIMEKLSEKDEDLQFLDLSTYTPTKTAPLPIVKPCHRCGMEHEEAYPTEACNRLLDAEVHIAHLTRYVDVLKAIHEKDYYSWDFEAWVNVCASEYPPRNEVENKLLSTEEPHA